MAKKRSKTKQKSQVKKGNNEREVNWVLCLVMSIIFGWVGVDRFMMGKVGTGLLKIFTLNGFGIWWLVDVILIATKYNYKGVKWIE